MTTTGEQIRKVNRVASAILFLLVLAVAAGILWLAGLEGKPGSSGHPSRVPATAPPPGQEVRGGNPESVPPARLQGPPDEPNRISTPARVPAPPPGQLDYLPPDQIPSPEPRSGQAGEFET